MRPEMPVLAMLVMVGSPAWAQMTPPLGTSLNPMTQPRAVKREARPAMAVQGTIKSLDWSSMTMTLDDGTMLTLAKSVGTSGLKEGSRVIATYEDKDRQKVATSVIQVREAPRS